jgi:hypothetical protein
MLNIKILNSYIKKLKCQNVNKLTYQNNVSKCQNVKMSKCQNVNKLTSQNVKMLKCQ